MKQFEVCFVFCAIPLHKRIYGNELRPTSHAFGATKTEGAKLSRRQTCTKLEPQLNLLSDLSTPPQNAAVARAWGTPSETPVSINLPFSKNVMRNHHQKI